MVSPDDCLCRFRSTIRSPVVQAKQLIQIVILGSQVIGKAFTRALRQELQRKASHVVFIGLVSVCLDAKTATQSGKTSAKTVQADRVAGMTLQVRNRIDGDEPLERLICFTVGSETNSSHRRCRSDRCGESEKSVRIFVQLE